MVDGQEKFVCIADLEGWGYSNSDMRGYQAALSILQVPRVLPLQSIIIYLMDMNNLSQIVARDGLS